MTQRYHARSQMSVGPAIGVISPEVDTTLAHVLRNSSRLPAVAKRLPKPRRAVSCRWAFKAPDCNSLALKHGSCVAACVSSKPHGVLETNPLIARGSMGQLRRTPTPPPP